MHYAWSIVPILVIVVPLSGFGLLRIDGPLWIVGAGLAILAAAIFAKDPWAGAFAFYVAIRWMTPVKLLGLEVASMVLFGLALLAASLYVPQKWDRAVKMFLAAAMIVQVIEATFQHYGFDPLWLWTRNSEEIGFKIIVHGTFGNPMYMGMFVAIIGTVMPWWLLPVALWGVFLSASASAGIALTLGLLWRWRKYWRISTPLILVNLIIIFLARHDAFGKWTFWTWGHRYAIWVGALHEWWRVPWFGFGPGGWLRAWPHTKIEIFAQAHNEYVQLLFDGGAVALLFVLGWAIYHYYDFATSEWTPAALAVASCAFGSFPFQIGGTAVLSLLVLGLSTRSEGRKWYERFYGLADLRLYSLLFWQLLYHKLLRLDRPLPTQRSVLQ